MNFVLKVPSISLQIDNPIDNLTVKLSVDVLNMTIIQRNVDSSLMFNVGSISMVDSNGKRILWTSYAGPHVPESSDIEEIPVIADSESIEAAPQTALNSMQSIALQASSSSSNLLIKSIVAPTVLVSDPPSTKAADRAKVLFGREGDSPDELSMQVGDILQIIHKDEGDWWFGANINTPEVEGYFPSNYVQLLPGVVILHRSPTEEVLVQFAAEEEDCRERAKVLYANASMQEGEWVLITFLAGSSMTSNTALSTTLTPHTGDLNITVGQIVVILSKDDGDWWEGYCEDDPDVTGVFPSNYVELLPVKTQPITLVKLLIQVVL